MGNIPLVAWLAAGFCFIFSLGGLSRHETSRRGNWLGIIGMLLAVGATLAVIVTSAKAGIAVSEGGDPAVVAMGPGSGGLTLVVLALLTGASIGFFLAARVAMTGMPELVAMLHSFVGFAAVLVGWSNWLTDFGHATGAEHTIHLVEIVVGIFVGGYTFTGSVIAWGKLNGKIASKPLMIPGRHAINLGVVVLALIFGAAVCVSQSWMVGLLSLIVVTLFSFGLGAHMVYAIGGADMPVVVSMLNSYSGWAASAIGFLLRNDLLIVTGALVGSSGAILSYIMCHAMNRSFVSVIMGGFGGETSAPASQAGGVPLKYHTTSAGETARWLLESGPVVIVPGYGMAVAQAQHSVREITRLLQSEGVQCRFAIHPVAGRLPGHMNVLLAEAKVPYDVVFEMEEINEDFPSTGTVLVIGANDIVNPGAETDAASPIYGMPVLKVWQAEHVVILKRSMGTGYSGVDNPLFYLDNSAMLFGDAKGSVDGVLAELRQRVSQSVAATS